VGIPVSTGKSYTEYSGGAVYQGKIAQNSYGVRYLVQSTIRERALNIKGASREKTRGVLNVGPTYLLFNGKSSGTAKKKKQRISEGGSRDLGSRGKLLQAVSLF